MTAWAALGLRAAGADTGGALDYLVAHEAELHEADRRRARGASPRRRSATIPSTLLARLPAKPDGRQRGDLADPRAAAERPSRSARARLVRARMRRRETAASRGLRGVAPDSNVTAWAVQALRAAGVKGTPIARALAYLRAAPGSATAASASSAGRAPDAQSTALVDPGVRRGRREAAAEGVRVPREAAPRRRQLPLLARVRDDAGVGHGAGLARARARSRFRSASARGGTRRDGAAARSRAAD